MSLVSSFSRHTLTALGWRLLDLPVRPRQAVIVAYLHTSNWDFAIGIIAMSALGLKAHWAGKHTLFRFPFGRLMRALGGIPIDRTAASGIVDQLVDQFARDPDFRLILTPEGTRSRTEGWKSGFHRVARCAAVPIVLGVIDAGRREIGLIATLPASEDVHADMTGIASRYEGRLGIRAAQASPVRLAGRDAC